MTSSVPKYIIIIIRIFGKLLISLQQKEISTNCKRHSDSIRHICIYALKMMCRAPPRTVLFLAPTPKSFQHANKHLSQVVLVLERARSSLFLSLTDLTSSQYLQKKYPSNFNGNIISHQRARCS